MRQRGQRLVAVGLEQIDAQIDRRAARERFARRSGFVAEALFEGAGQPFREIAAHPDGRLGQIRASERGAFGFRQRLGRMALAVEQRLDGGKIEFPNL